MKQFTIFLKKECLESWRNFKWIWMPLVFILLGLTQPITTYYMPKILKSAGNLPPGAVIKIPIPSAPEVLFSTIDQQFNMIGILVIILAFMASIPSEKKNGSAALILVKPVSFTAYIMSKWVGALLIVWISYALGMLANWYYTFQLFAWVDLKGVVKGSLVYGLWLTFVLTLVFFFGSFLKSSVINAALSLGLTIILNLATSLLTEKFLWLPTRLTDYSGKLIKTPVAPDGTIAASIVTIILIGLLLIAGISIFKRKELV